MKETEPDRFSSLKSDYNDEYKKETKRKLEENKKIYTKQETTKTAKTGKIGKQKNMLDIVK